MSGYMDNWRAGGTGRGVYNFYPRTVGTVPITINGLAGSGPTDILLQVKNSGGTLLFTVDNSGNITNAGSTTIVADEYITGNLTITGNFLTLANDPGTTFNIPITGTDATVHTWDFQIDSSSIFSVAATGDGAGGVLSGSRKVSIVNNVVREILVNSDLDRTLQIRNDTPATLTTSANSPGIYISGAVWNSNTLASQTKAFQIQNLMNPANGGIGSLAIRALNSSGDLVTMIDFGGLDGSDSFARGFFSNNVTFNGLIASLTYYLQNSSGFGLVPTATYGQSGYIDSLFLRSGDVGKPVVFADSNGSVTLTEVQFSNYLATGLNKRSVAAGLTASTTQAQGQGPLTCEINEVSTCANANDVRTLPTAVAGYRVVVINNGAQTLQVFPASGDNLGAGVNTSTTIIAGARKEFISYDATNWVATTL